MKQRRCALCGKNERIESHHVLGRIGPYKDEPHNLIDLCWSCHFWWHNYRTDAMEDKIYAIMKSRHGNRFPMLVNGRPYYTKWLLKAEERNQRKKVDEDVGDGWET